MEDLCAAINDDLLPPVLQAALVHAQFETIHPFEDGNGRTGRALIHVVLKRRGVAMNYVPPISAIFAHSRERYINGLTAFRLENARDWIEIFAAAAHKSAGVARQYVDAVNQQIRTWKSMLSETLPQLRSDAAAWRIIDVLPAHPLITAPIAGAAIQRSKPQTYQALGQLLNAQIVQPAGRAGRAEVYEAAGIIDLLAQLETGVLPDQA